MIAMIQISLEVAKKLTELDQDVIEIYSVHTNGIVTTCSVINTIEDFDRATRYAIQGDIIGKPYNEKKTQLL